MIKINRFIIKAKLPSLNDVIAQNRTNKYYANKFKQDIQELIGWAIKQALAAGTLKPVKRLCNIEIYWHEKTLRRDVDNIQSSQKFVLDALVENGVLINDSRKYVAQIYHKVIHDNEDFVEVRVEELR